MVLKTNRVSRRAWLKKNCNLGTRTAQGFADQIISSVLLNCWELVSDSILKFAK